MDIRSINGWQVLFQRKPEAKTINIRAVVHAGSAHEPTEKLYGAAHFLEHMFFKGTKTRTYTEVNRAFAKLGDVNAYTSLERTVFYLTTIPEELNQALNLFFELFFQASMPDEEFEKERGVILEEYQSSEDNPIAWGVKRINEDTWGSALHPTIGKRESIESLTLSDLRAFRDEMYNPQRTLFVVTGNFDADKLEDTLSSLIDSLDSLSTSKISEPIPTFKKEHYSLENPKSKQSLLFLVFPTIPERQSREMRFLPELAVNLIGGGMHSILFESIREKLGLCYSVGMQYLTPCAQGYHTIYALLDRANIQKAFDEVGVQMQNLKQTVSDELFDTAKANLLFGRSVASETASGVGAQADAYFDLEGKLIPFEEYKMGINSLKKEDLIQFADKYLVDPKVAVVNGEVPT
jgi:predicted Zn-dependent peptidase